MHVVLVEPSGIGLKFLTKMLQDRGDRVTQFTDGTCAMAYVEEDESVDVVMTSFETVSKSGLELCWDLRLLSQAGRPIYTIAMSSSYEHSKLIEALDCGADDFIRKPPEVTELHARLRAAERLLLTQRELVRLANIDALTGMYNRRAFFEKSIALRSICGIDQKMAAIMFDIDHFKRVNDHFGHDVGDEAIRQVANIAQTAGMAMSGGIAGRLGGEEFALIVRDCRKTDAHDVAESMRAQIEALRIDTPQGILELTCSFGVSPWLQGDSIDAVLKRADLALYQAKNHGRNQVVDFEALVDDRAEAS